jgi:hypothetical protein
VTVLVRYALRGAVAIALVAQLVAIWQVRHLPTQDGGAHVYNASLPYAWPNDSDGAAAASPVVTRYLEPRDTFASWLPHRIVGAAAAMIGVARAEHLVVSVYFVLFAAAAWWVVRAVAPDQGSLAVIAAMLAFNYTLHMGFYGFCLSVTGALFVIGLWLRPGRRRLTRLAGLAIALAVTQLLHPFGLVLSGIVCGCLTLADQRAAGPRWRAAAIDLALLALAAVPALALFVRDLEGGGMGLAYLLPSPSRVLHRLTSEPDWIGFTNLEWLPLAAGLGVPLALTGPEAVARWRRGQIVSADGFALAAMVIGGLFLGMPEYMASGGFVTARFLLWTALAAALWVAAVPRADRSRTALTAIGLAASIALAAVAGVSYRQTDGLLADQARAMALVPPHSTLLALSVADTGVAPDPRRLSNRPRPFLHAAGRAVARRDVMQFDNYQAEVGHFPIRFRPGVQVPDQSAVHEFPWGPRLEWPAPTGAPGGDYVAIWGPIDSPHFAGGVLPEVLATLQRDYTLVHRSPPGGLAHVWRRK